MYNLNIKKDMISFKKLPRTAWVSIVSHVKSHWLEGWLNKTKLIMSPRPQQNCIPFVSWHSFHIQEAAIRQIILSPPWSIFDRCFPQGGQLKTDRGSINPRSSIEVNPYCCPAKHSKPLNYCSSPQKVWLKSCVFLCFTVRDPKSRKVICRCTRLDSKTEAILAPTLIREGF